MQHATVGNGVPATRINIDGCLAIHKHLDMEPVIIVAIIDPERDLGTVLLGVGYLVIKNSAREIKSLIPASAVTHILARTCIGQVTRHSADKGRIDPTMITYWRDSSSVLTASTRCGSTTFLPDPQAARITTISNDDNNSKTFLIIQDSL